MKRVNLPKLVAICLVAVFSIGITSCSNDNGDIATSQKQSRLKKAMRQLAGENSTTTNENDEDHSDDFIAGVDCFDFVFPLNVTDGTIQKTVNNKEELASFYAGLNENDAPDFVYPITIKLEDETEKNITSVEELDQQYEKCLSNETKCFTLNFPFTVTDGTTNTVVANEAELDAFYDTLAGDVEPNFVYPITVTKENGTNATINNDEQFDALYQECHKFEDQEDLENFDCFSPKYPITASGTQINSDEELENFLSNLSEDQTPDFTFPMTLKMADGSEKQVNNAEELEAEFKKCFNEEVEEEDCVRVLYPVTVVKTDGTTATVNNDDEFMSFLDGLSEEEEFNFQYPFSVQFKNGTQQEVTSEEAFFTILENCGL